MPIPVAPPQGDAQLNDNARTVIEKRYLVKDGRASQWSSRKTCSGAWRRTSPRRIAVRRERG